MLIAGLITVLAGIFAVLYFRIKQMGREELENESRTEALKDVEEVRKRDITHSDDTISDVDKQLQKDARD